MFWFIIICERSDQVEFHRMVDAAEEHEVLEVARRALYKATR